MSGVRSSPNSCQKLRIESSSAAFTLIEILVSIGIIAVLLTASVPLFDTFVKRSKKAKCLSHMRAVHGGMLGYLNDKGHWPQMEEGKFKYIEEDFFEFWIKSTEPYGLSQESWLCPSDRSLEMKLSKQKKKYYGSYIATRFDRNPQTPYRWNQPWAMERGNFHKQGCHMVMPDGSVHSTMNPFYGR